MKVLDPLFAHGSQRRGIRHRCSSTGADTVDTMMCWLARRAVGSGARHTAHPSTCESCGVWSEVVVLQTLCKTLRRSQNTHTTETTPLRQRHTHTLRRNTTTRHTGNKRSTAKSRTKKPKTSSCASSSGDAPPCASRCRKKRTRRARSCGARAPVSGALTSEAQSAGSSRRAHLLLQMAQPAGRDALEVC